ncbi:MAG: U32 family peptidase [Hyphomicrobiales bacterium]|nr:U32 family peptidase [Hyphomicrobiales bacterium]
MEGQEQLTLGPALFNWPAERWRDFYFTIADEAPVDRVYLGEVVCSKRAPFYAAVLPEVAARLEAGGKQVVFSTLALITNAREAQAARDLCGDETLPVEANDPSALAYLRGRAHVVGPYVNVYNEDTLLYLAGEGARRVCLPVELPATSLAALGKAARGHVELEVQVFGRLPLALSARCYHARAHGLHKDNCQFVCAEDPDGLALRTLSDQPFLAVNGIQTLSHAYVNLIDELGALQDMGIAAFRLSPQNCGMVDVAETFRAVVDGRIDATEATRRLSRIAPEARFSKSFFEGEAQRA